MGYDIMSNITYAGLCAVFSLGAPLSMLVVVFIIGGAIEDMGKVLRHFFAGGRHIPGVPA